MQFRVFRLGTILEPKQPPRRWFPKGPTDSRTSFAGARRRHQHGDGKVRKVSHPVQIQTKTHIEILDNQVCSDQFQLPDDRFGKQTVLQIVLCRTFWNHLFLCNEIGIFLDGTLKFHVVCLRPNRWPLVLKDVPRTAGDRKDSWSKKCFHRSTLQTAFNAGNNPKSAIWRIYECELWSV